MGTRIKSVFVKLDLPTDILATWFFQFIHFHQLQYSSRLSKSQLDILHFTFCGIFLTNDPAFNPKILKKLIFKNSLLKLLSAVLQCLLTSCVLFSKPQFNNHSGLNIILLHHMNAFLLNHV